MSLFHKKVMFQDILVVECGVGKVSYSLFPNKKSKNVFYVFNGQESLLIDNRLRNIKKSDFKVLLHEIKEQFPVS